MNEKALGQDEKLVGNFRACRACILGLAETASEMAAKDPQTRQKAEKAGKRLVEASQAEDLTSPEVASRMFRLIKNITGAADPYQDYKTREMEQGRQMYARLAAQWDRPPDLRQALALAALGNSLDFFRPADQALPEAERLLAGGFDFFHDDTEKLDRFLARRPKLVLYLADNAGEVFFDQALYQILSRRAERVMLAVKAGPVLNDLTRDDLEQAGLNDVFSDVVDTGADGAGIEWGRVSSEFLDLLDRADLVLAKGMANFETLYGRRISPAAFYVFKVKCRPMKDFLQAPPETYWALWRNGPGEKS